MRITSDAIANDLVPAMRARTPVAAPIGR